MYKKVINEKNKEYVNKIKYKTLMLTRGSGIIKKRKQKLNREK